MSQTKWSANCLMGYCNLTLPDRLILILIDKKILSCTGQSFIGQKKSSQEGNRVVRYGAEIHGQIVRLFIFFFGQFQQTE